jgi:hypothetical protein
MKIKIILISLLSILLISCQKQYAGYCVSGSSPSDYQVLEFVESASTRRAAERKVERVLNEKFPTNGEWTCDAK